MIDKLMALPIFEGKIDSHSRSGKVYNYVVRKILCREMPLGVRLTEVQLARETNVSTVPVRDALQKLSHDGWIKRIPYKGAYVTDLNRIEVVEDLILTRQIVECGAATIAMERITSAQLKKIEKSLEDFGKLTAESELCESLPVEIDFHRTIVLAAGCKRMLEVFDSVILQFLCIKGCRRYEPGMLAQLEQSHRLIYDAIVGRDCQLLVERIKQHIIDGNSYVLKELEK